MKQLGLLLCSVSALASVGLGYLYTQRLEDEVSGGPKTSVLVAAEDIPVSATLTEKQLALRDIPRAYLESRHVKAADIRQVIGQRVTGGIKANEAIFSSDLAKFAERRQLSGLVANGMRAISIDGRAADFDGLLRPGDHVDVLLSMGALADSSGATHTLLQNLLVLSVGGTTLRGDSSEKTYSRGATVTVSASVEQAQVLTEAMRRGKLTLTLRNNDDITIVEGIAETGSKDLVARNPQQSKGSVMAITKGGRINAH
ncbi:MAG TPA: Flp pilus assembly protein CpaB [Polyangiaceae bacterium]|nr:Flp pilus assembly protein CpaB [Polyangiaceae bacterium]